MRPTRITRTVVVLVIGGFFGTAVFAEPNDGDFRSKQGGSWGSIATWQRYNAKDALLGGPGWQNAITIPGVGHLATIREGHSVFTSGASRNIGTLIIEDSNATPGKLEIRSTGASGLQSVTVTFALQMENTLTNPGEVFFTDGGLAGTVGKLIAAGNITVSGKVYCQAPVRGGSVETFGSAVLTVAPMAVIEAPSGPLALTGNVEMDGTVRANGAYALTVGGALRIGSSGNWVVSHSSGTLRFNTTNPLTIDCSVGYILIQAGTFDVDQTFTFSGGLRQTGGAIDVAVGKTLTVTGRYLGN